MSIEQLRGLRETEKQARRDFMAAAAQEWDDVESQPYRTVIADLIRKLLDSGHKRKDLLNALGTSNYGTIVEYLNDTPSRRSMSVQNTGIMEKDKTVDRITFTFRDYLLGDVLLNETVVYQNVSGVWLPSDPKSQGAIAVEAALTRKELEL